MKCNDFRPGFELESPCPFPTTITITPRAPPDSVMVIAEETGHGDTSLKIGRDFLHFT